MDLFSKRNIKNLLEKHQIRPSKQLGQHFLIDKGAARKIIEAAQLKKEDVVLEIGPGIGNLTQELAKRVKKVIAVEKDRKMVEILRELLDCWNIGNIEIVERDILKLPIRRDNFPPGYKVVGNLPYYITSPVIRKFLEVETRPLMMILTVQKEVAQRICAKPPDMNLLAVSVQFYAKPEIIAYVSKKSFWPRPKVDSATIKISKIKNRVSIYGNEGKEKNKVLFAHQISKIDNDLFFEIVRAGFSQPRKQILNNLSKKLKLDKTEVKSWLLKNKINPARRAETLSVKDWINLTKNFHF